MGLVVEFGVRPVPTGRRKPTQPCEITIFPGVRYEHHERTLGAGVDCPAITDVRPPETPRR